MKAAEKSNFGAMISKIEKVGNKVNIFGEGFEIEVSLEKPSLIIKMIAYEKEIYSGTFFQAAIQEGEQDSQYRDLLRDFQHVERIFQCFTNENYFLIDPRMATIFLRLEQEVRINGFQRTRLERHIIHLEQTPMTDLQKLFLKLMKMQEVIKQLKEGEDLETRKREKEKHSQEIQKLNQKCLYLRKKSNEQQRQIDFLMQKIGEDVRVEYKEKKIAGRSKKTVKNNKEKVKLMPKDKKQQRISRLKAYNQQSHDQDSSCSSESSDSSSEENQKPAKKVKKQQRENPQKQQKAQERKDEHMEIGRKNMEMIIRKKQSEMSEEMKREFWKRIDLSKSLVFYYRSCFLVIPEHKYRIVFKGGDSRWMQCVINRQIFEQEEKVFDFRIVRTKYRKIMIGIVSNSRMRDLSSYRTGKSITYRGEDGIIKQGEFQKTTGRGFGEKDFVRMTIDIKNHKIEWKVGHSLDSLRTQAVSSIPEHIIRDGVYMNFQMHNEGDTIQIIPH